MIVLFKRIYQHIDPRRKFHILILLILMIIASFSEILTLGAILPFLSVLISPEQLFNNSNFHKYFLIVNINDPKNLLLPISVIFAITVVLSGIMRLSLLWFQTKICYSIGADFSFSIYRRTLFQKYSVHISRNSSEVISGISNKANSIMHGALIPILSTLSSVLMLTMLLGVLLYINPIVTIISILGFAGIYASIIKFTNKRLSYYSYISSVKSTQVVKVIQEGLGGIRDVLIDGTQNTYCEIYKKADSPLRNAQANVVIISGSPRFGIESLGIVLIIILAYTLATRDGGIGTAIPTLGAFAMGAQRMLPILQQAYSCWAIIKSSEDYLNDTLDLLDQPLPDYALDNKAAPMKFKHKITFNNISFKYSEKTEDILSQIFLEIKKGECIGFMGATGSGKSTLLDILMGLITPNKGQLLIDDTAINESNSRFWQSHIAHVPQTIFLSDSTIAENIAFGIPFDEIDLKRVRDVSKKAQISDIIETWDLKYMTYVGERGIRLSGGQRQRIGIARALYKNADVIVFDEATSALDSETEKEVMSSIQNLSQDLTVFIVAHRLTTLKNCTKIVEISNGKILKIGSYLEIVQNKLLI